MIPIARPDRWAIVPTLLGTNVWIMFPIVQAIEAMNKGIGNPNAKTAISGLIIVSAPIIPNIAPDAPREEV